MTRNRICRRRDSTTARPTERDNFYLRPWASLIGLTAGARYIGCAMMAGGYLAIGGFVSATTKNQVIAFVLTTTLCFVFTAMSAPVVMGLFSGWAPAAVLDFLRTLGFMYHFNDISKGVIDIRDVVFFSTVIALFLFLNAVVVQQRKAN